MSKRWLEKDNFITGAETKGDDLIITHAQNIDPYLKAAKAERLGNFYGNRGFSEMGNMRKVASIPDVLYTKLISDDPELASDPNKLLKKIKSLKTDEGLDFMTVEKI